MEIKAALGQARKSQEAQFAKDWQDRLKQLKAEEVSTTAHACTVSVLPSVSCSSKLRRSTPTVEREPPFPCICVYHGSVCVANLCARLACNLACVVVP